MTWIKLHSYGKECWCDFPNHIHLERNAQGGTCVYRSGTGAYDETPEQIIALIAEAERESPKIDAQKLWALIKEFEYALLWVSVERPHVAETVSRIRDQIKKELGL